MPYESFAGGAAKRVFAILNVTLDVDQDAYVYEVQISMPVYLPESDVKYHVYSVLRRFNDFKRLYEGVGDVDGLKLPEYGLWSVLRADDAAFLAQRKLGLETMLKTIEENATASRSGAFAEFLASPQMKLNGDVSFQQLTTTEDATKSRANSADRSSNATLVADDEATSADP
ncbi:hypothetical protein SPRG_14655 [Saprolegnia parasitica CBS 223.65]|uniref:PX domain-containing protein n=1 Tax=Saprolegnia parasitica (strain CBS 223.65) TaxID=695850 RepID=A0A067BY09_SAPPC|nr:hypothetical protein SPRG_14655 [Saprolegnia parasitica CBS 223.65]KDO19472.1 hypothetical protein SPRG_14655 [Saprolegnia parasitica CBS 223.65]|eukprot:XP_012209816.1 hypothetical protein SPRG_14655 [Saprolegnia parasitica CBS 223.65]